jgi:hypothetical protein
LAAVRDRAEPHSEVCVSNYSGVDLHRETSPKEVGNFGLRGDLFYILASGILKEHCIGSFAECAPAPD